MSFSLKQKQVLVVTLMVAIIVIALSLLNLINTAGVLLVRAAAVSICSRARSTRR